MKKPAFAALATLLSIGAYAQHVPVIPFEATEPLKLPTDVYFGEIGGVALNSKRHVFVYSRTGIAGSSITAGQRAQLFEFGPEGKFIREIGKNLYSMAWAHSVRIDKDDNIWLVDAGSDEVVELGPDYQKKLVLGRRDESLGARTPRPVVPPGTPVPPARLGWFNEPTDVAWDPQGNIFVGDGYKNHNVHKFNKDGDNVKLVGSEGNGPLQFHTVHAIAVDKKGLVYVDDRENGRIQVLDNDLNFIRYIKYQVSIPADYVSPVPNFGPAVLTQPGEVDEKSPIRSMWPTTLCITPGEHGEQQYLYTNDTFPGNIQKFTLDGKLVGEIHAGAGHKVGQIGWGHGMACVSENEIWVGDLINWRVQKFVLHPDRATTR